MNDDLNKAATEIAAAAKIIYTKMWVDGISQSGLTSECIRQATKAWVELQRRQYPAPGETRGD